MLTPDQIFIEPSLIFNLGHLSHVTLLQVVQMFVITEVYTIIDISLHNQVNVKRSRYSNSCYVAYLQELTFCFNVHVMKQPVLRRVAYCYLPMSIEDAHCVEELVLWVFVAKCLTVTQLV